MFFSSRNIFSKLARTITTYNHNIRTVGEKEVESLNSRDMFLTALCLDNKVRMRETYNNNFY